MNTPTSIETLLGGAKFTAIKRDSSQQEIFIRQIGVEDCPAYLELQGSEPDMAEFICSQPEGWFKSLTPECQEELTAQVDRINADFFSRWVERQKKRAERLLPGILEKRIAALSASPTSPPK